jgi:hypothetical protein
VTLHEPSKAIPSKEMSVERDSLPLPLFRGSCSVSLSFLSCNMPCFTSYPKSQHPLIVPQKSAKQRCLTICTGSSSSPLASSDIPLSSLRKIPQCEPHWPSAQGKEPSIEICAPVLLPGNSRIVGLPLSKRHHLVGTSNADSARRYHDIAHDNLLCWTQHSRL